MNVFVEWSLLQLIVGLTEKKCWRLWVEHRVVNLKKVKDQERWFDVSGVLNLQILRLRSVAGIILSNDLMGRRICLMTDMQQLSLVLVAG